MRIRASTRLAIIDICDRIQASLETSQPFEFSNADDALLAILFPEEIPLEAINPVAFPSAPEFAGPVPLVQQEAPPQRFELCTCSDEQLLKEFLAEANEHLQNIEQLVLTLEGDPRNREVVNDLFRGVHSIKVPQPYWN